MKNNTLFYVELAASFLPFVLFVLLNGRVNLRKEIRHRQYAMPVFAVLYSLVLFVFLGICHFV